MLGHGTLKKDKDGGGNKENISPIKNAENECIINVDINGFNISLNPDSIPPKAEDLFHAMFFDEELPKAPSHYRQQRWNKRRIQKRWNWKRGREREIYEKRAEYLKNKWIEMKKDYESNNNTKLSKEFLDKNTNLKINDNDTIDEINNNKNNNNNDSSPPNDNKSKTNSPKSINNDDGDDQEINFCILSNITDINYNNQNNKMNTMKINKHRNNNMNETKKLSKLEGKRKHIRRREKLIERIANGETLEDFVDHQKLNNIDNEKDNLLFGGTQNNHKKSKSKKSKKRNKNNIIAPMKLADFVEAAKQLSNHKKINKNNNNNNNNKEHKKRNKGDINESHNKVSLDDIQAEQIKHFKELTRRKRDEIHGVVSNNNSKLFANKLKKSSSSSRYNNIKSPSSQKNQYPLSLTSSPHSFHGNNNMETMSNMSSENNSDIDINPSLRHLMKIINYDHMTFREKVINEIYCGCSVFSCIPCCVEATNTLLISAIFIEKLLMPHSTLSSLSGLFELKKRLKKQFIDKTIEILPIFERAYIDKQCQQLLLIQFQDEIDQHFENDDNANCVLSLYNSWKQQIQQIQQIKNSNNNNNNNIRIEFIEKWFGKSYFLQHSYLWSDIALNSMITIYDNNNKYIENINKTARHCRCSYNKRIIYFPPFNPTYSNEKNNNNLNYSNHDTNCILSCCCCTFYDDGINNNIYKPQQIDNNITVLWHGRKCITDSKIKHSNQEYRIQINECIGKYVVALSSLQIIKKYTNLQNNQIIKINNFNDLNSNQSTFDSQKCIWDDLSFVKYMKKFWNIPNFTCLL